MRKEKTTSVSWRQGCQDETNKSKHEHSREVDETQRKLTGRLDEARRAQATPSGTAGPGPPCTVRCSRGSCPPSRG